MQFFLDVRQYILVSFGQNEYDILVTLILHFSWFGLNEYDILVNFAYRDYLIVHNFINVSNSYYSLPGFQFVDSDYLFDILVSVG